MKNALTILSGYVWEIGHDGGGTTPLPFSRFVTWSCTGCGIV